MSYIAQSGFWDWLTGSSMDTAQAAAANAALKEKQAAQLAEAKLAAQRTTQSAQLAEIDRKLAAATTPGMPLPTLPSDTLFGLPKNAVLIGGGIALLALMKGRR